MPHEVIQYLQLMALTVLPQVRDRMDQGLLEGLARSVASVGILQPIRVRRDGNRLVIVDGHRRYYAAKMAGLETVPVIIEEKSLCEAEVIERQLIANLQREDLRPMAKARGVADLMRSAEWTACEVAERLGLSSATVSRLLALLDLPDEIQQRVEAGEIPASAAYKLTHVEDAHTQRQLASEVAEGKLNRDALNGAVKANGRKSVEAASGEPARITAPLGGGRTVSVSGPGLTLDSLIEWLEELLAKARKARPKGLALPTFLQVLKDQAKA